MQGEFHHYYRPQRIFLPNLRWRTERPRHLHPQGAERRHYPKSPVASDEVSKLPKDPPRDPRRYHSLQTYWSHQFCEIAEAEATDYPCDTSTWQRMKRWLSWFLAFARSVERGLVCFGLLATTMDTGNPLRVQTVYFVRLVINSGNWIHNRSAMSVA